MIKKSSENTSDRIEGVELPDHAEFSESFIAELDKALNEYRQKQSKSK